MRAILLALFAGCTPAATTVTVEHPAHPDAPTGRLAGPPAALRPGVASEPTSTETPKEPAPPAHQGHEGHH